MVPVNFGFPKRVPASGDTICGIFLPAGTDVYVNYHSMMRSQEIFGEDADTFRPERFLGGGPNVAQMIKTIELAFGNGRFMCLGKVLAWLEMNKLFIEVSSRPWPNSDRHSSSGMASSCAAITKVS